MADNSFKINKSVNFNPQPGLPANPMDGDFFYDANAQTFAYFHNGAWANFDSVTSVAAITDMTAAQMTPAVVRNSVIKISGTGVFPHLCGLSASFSARTIKVYNDTDHWISVEYNSSVEPTANNRILTPTLGSMNIIVGEIATFTYDIIQNRWLLVSISSQGGAQVPATITSNGLVSLHQASATPWEPIVFTDGDKDTATGFVGLDANRAAFVAAPLTSVTALTLTSADNASALVINGGANTAAAIINAGSLANGLIVNGVNGAIALVGFGNGANGAGGGFYGSGFGPGAVMQGGSTSVGGSASSQGNYAAFAATGYTGTPLLDLHLTNGLVGLTAAAGGTGGDAIVSKGVGTGFAGIHTYGDVNGHGIIADAGGGTGFAGIFNGKVNVSSTLDATGLTTVGGLVVTTTNGISTADGFVVAGTTANTSTTGTLGSVGMLSVDTGNAFDGTWTTTSKSLHFGASSGEGIGSKRTAGGNLNGLDFYTNNLSRMSIANGGLVTIPGSLTVNGTTTVSAIASSSTLSAVSDIIVDSSGIFDGGLSAGTEQTVRFGGTNSGEAIGSKRTAGGNQFGLDLFTQGIPRISIANGGLTTVSGALTVNGFLVGNAGAGINGTLTANNGFTVSGATNLNGSINLNNTVNTTNNMNVGAQLQAGTNGGSYIHRFINDGNLAPISLTGARDPVGYGDTNGAFWFGATSNLAAGSGTTWYLNVCIYPFIYRFHVGSTVVCTV